MALNAHFKCHGPEGWHLVRKKAANGAREKTLTQLRAEGRLLSQPKWVTSYLCDVVSCRAIRLCKNLPTIDSFIFSKIEQAENAQLGACAKRQRVEEKVESKYEPRHLSATLWKHLNITTTSLSKNIRPGVKPR